MIDTAERFRELVLEQLQYAAQTRVSAEFLRTAQVHVAANFLADDLTVAITNEVLAERVQVDNADVPFTATVQTSSVPRSVLVDLPQTWWRRALRRPPRSVWGHVVGDAVHVTDDESIDLHGTATVRAEYFRTFPEATIEYPRNLGPVRMLVRTDAPWFSGLDGPA